MGNTFCELFEILKEYNNYHEYYSEYAYSEYFKKKKVFYSIPQDCNDSREITVLEFQKIPGRREGGAGNRREREREKNNKSLAVLYTFWE